MSIDEYISGLTGEGLASTLRNAQNIEVSAAIPVFKSDFDIEMSDIMSGLGMGDAFNEHLANLTKLGYAPGENLFISTLIHKTFISVDPAGTKAAAVGIVVIGKTVTMQTSKVVHLDRPFVYMLLDCETNLPFFIGAMMSI